MLIFGGVTNEIERLPKRNSELQPRKWRFLKPKQWRFGRWYSFFNWRIFLGSRIFCGAYSKLFTLCFFFLKRTNASRVWFVFGSKGAMKPDIFVVELGQKFIEMRLLCVRVCCKRAAKLWMKQKILYHFETRYDEYLGGGFKKYVHPSLGKMNPIWRTYFSKGLKHNHQLDYHFIPWLFWVRWFFLSFATHPNLVAPKSSGCFRSVPGATEGVLGSGGPRSHVGSGRLGRQGPRTGDLDPRGSPKRFGHLGSQGTPLPPIPFLLLMVQKSGIHQLIWLMYPIIYRVSYIPGGAGFQPSTVILLKWNSLWE